MEPFILLHYAGMPSVTFLLYFFFFILYFDENTSKILQDFGKYCFFSKFITTVEPRYKEFGYNKTLL